MTIVKRGTLANANNWDERQRLFQAWLCLPYDIRNPRTQSELAKILNVEATRLSEWKRIPGFMEAVHRLAYDELKEALPQVFNNIKRRAIEGDKRDWVDLYLSLLGGANVVAGANASMTINQMTEDEAAALLERSIGLKLTARVVSDE